MRSREDLNRLIRGQRTEANTAELPLKNIRVIDLATVLAAPFAATLMGDFGAEVIKIENPDIPDAIRGWGVLEPGIQPFWLVFSRNKFPMTINLKSPEGKEIFLKLIEKSDVLIENMRPGTMEKLDLGMERLTGINPGLVVGRVSGFGQTGPYASKPGFGTLAEGLSGYTYLNAQPGGVPTCAPLALADYIAGMNLAFAIMIALKDQQRGQRGGQVIDISLYEPLFNLFGGDFLSYTLSGEIPQPRGNEVSFVAPRNNYQTKDKKWVTLSASAQKPFERLMEAVGRPDMLDDPRFKTNEARIIEENRRYLNQVISEWIGSKDLEEVIEVSDRLGVTVGPIANMEDIAKDPHYRERQSYIQLEDLATGTPFNLPNVPFRMLGTPGRIRFPGLPEGSANEVILRDLLGYSNGDVGRLREIKAI